MELLWQLLVILVCLLLVLLGSRAVPLFEKHTQLWFPPDSRRNAILIAVMVSAYIYIGYPAGVVSGIGAAIVGMFAAMIALSPQTIEVKR